MLNDHVSEELNVLSLMARDDCIFYRFKLRTHDQLYLLSLLSQLMLLHMHYVEKIYTEKTACCDAVIELNCFL